KQPTQSTNKEDAETHLVQFAKHEVRPRSRLRSLGKRQQSRQGKRPRISVPIFRERFAERLECFRSRRANRQRHTTPPRPAPQRTGCWIRLRQSDCVVVLNQIFAPTQCRAVIAPPHRRGG